MNTNTIKKIDKIEKMKAKYIEHYDKFCVRSKDVWIKCGREPELFDSMEYLEEFGYKYATEVIVGYYLIVYGEEAFKIWNQNLTFALENKYILKPSSMDNKITKILKKLDCNI